MGFSARLSHLGAGGYIESAPEGRHLSDIPEMNPHIPDIPDSKVCTPVYFQ